MLKFDGDPLTNPPRLIARDMRRTITTKKVHWFCEPCNTGWMSQIERRAKLALLPLIEGEQRVLTVEEQHIIATWAYLKAVVIAFDTPDRVQMSPAQRRWFMRHQRPLPGSFVQGFPYDLAGRDTEMRMTYWTADVLRRRQPDTRARYWSVVIVMHKLCLHVSGGPLSGPLDLLPLFSDSAHFWPAVGRPLWWPQPAVFFEAAVDRLSHEGPIKTFRS